MNISSTSPLTSLVNSAQTLKRNRKDLEERFEESRRECEFQEQRAEELTQKLKQCRSENELLQSKLKTLKINMEHLTYVEEKYKDLKSENEDYKKKLTNLESELERKTTLVKQLRFDYEQNAFHCDSVMEEKQDLINKYEEVKRHYNDEQETHDYTRQKLNETMQRLASVEQHWMQRVEDLHRDFETKLRNANARLHEVESQLQLEQDMSCKVRLNYQSKIQQLEAAVNEQSNSAEDAKAELAKSTEKCSIAEVEVHVLRSKLTNSEVKVHELSERVAEQDKERESVKVQLNACAAQCSTLKSDLNATRMQLTASEARCCELTERIAEQDKCIETVTEKLRECATRCAELKTDVEITCAKLTASEEQCAKLEARVAELNELNSKSKECGNCEALEQKCRDMLFREENYQNVMTKKDNALEDAKKELDNYYNKCVMLDAERIAAKRDLANAEDKIKELTDVVSSSSFNLHAMEARVKELMKELETSQEKISIYSCADQQQRRKQELEERNAKLHHHMRDHYSTQWDSNINFSSPSSRYFKKSGNSLTGCLTSPFRALTRQKRATDGNKGSTCSLFSKDSCNIGVERSNSS